MDPLVEYGTALVIGTSPCRQKGEGTEGIYAADAHAAAAAAAAAGSYRTRGHGAERFRCGAHCEARVAVRSVLLLRGEQVPRHQEEVLEAPRT